MGTSPEPEQCSSQTLEKAETQRRKRPRRRKASRRSAHHLVMVISFIVRPSAPLRLCVLSHQQRPLIASFRHTESKNPAASEGASTQHPTRFFDCVTTRLRPLGTPLRMTLEGGKKTHETICATTKTTIAPNSNIAPVRSQDCHTVARFSPRLASVEAAISDSLSTTISRWAWTASSASG